MSGRRKSEGEMMPRIDRSVLRDHGEDRRVDRVWERIDRDLSLGPAPAPSTPRRWPQLAAAVAAGFALGAGVGGWLWSQNDAGAVVMEPAPVESDETGIFAAGTSPQTYPLPGGGVITLEPGSIVDSVGDRRGGLTLRLVSGEATVATPAGQRRNERLAMKIGDAEVVTAAGRMRVRHDGNTAYLRVLDGSASVRSPHGEQSDEDLVLGPDQEARVPVRIVTASNETSSTPHLPGPLEAEETEGASGDEEEGVASSTPPDWMLACDRYAYAEAAKLFTHSGGNTGQVADPQYLLCLGSGHKERGDDQSAASVLERVIGDFDDASGSKMLAAAELESIYGRLGESEKAQKYGELKQRLSRGGLLLSADALCDKISREFDAENFEGVRSLASRYKSQFPDGACTDTIEQILAKLAARAEPAEDVYEDLDGAGGGSAED